MLDGAPELVLKIKLGAWAIKGGGAHRHATRAAREADLGEGGAGRDKYIHIHTHYVHTHTYVGTQYMRMISLGKVLRLIQCQASNHDHGNCVARVLKYNIKCDLINQTLATAFRCRSFFIVSSLMIG